MDKSSVTSHRCLTEEELSVFRTQPCVHRALKRTCPSGDDCVNSHCLSWCRRDPYNIPYRARLCPFVIFRREQRQTRVKNFCNRRRWCPYAHTKEEQMYHPSIYKTKLCRIHPHCSRVCCPFAHGVQEIRQPTLQYNESFPVVLPNAPPQYNMAYSIGYPVFPDAQHCPTSYCATDDGFSLTPFPSSLSSPESYRTSLSGIQTRSFLSEANDDDVADFSAFLHPPPPANPYGNVFVSPGGYVYVRVGMTP